MIIDQPAQMMALLRSGKMINIGGRPVIVPRESATPPDRGRAIKLALAFTAIYLVWGSTYLAIRYAVETIPPLVTAGIRHTVAGGIMLTWAWMRGFRPTRQQWISGVIVGSLFFLVGHGTRHRRSRDPDRSRTHAWLEPAGTVGRAAGIVVVGSRSCDLTQGEAAL